MSRPPLPDGFDIVPLVPIRDVDRSPERVRNNPNEKPSSRRSLVIAPPREISRTPENSRQNQNTTTTTTTTTARNVTNNNKIDLHRRSQSVGRGGVLVSSNRLESPVRARVPSAPRTRGDSLPMKVFQPVPKASTFQNARNARKSTNDAPPSPLTTQTPQKSPIQSSNVVRMFLHMKERDPQQTKPNLRSIANNNSLQRSATPTRITTAQNSPRKIPTPLKTPQAATTPRYSSPSRQSTPSRPSIPAISNSNPNSNSNHTTNSSPRKPQQQQNSLRRNTAQNSTGISSGISSPRSSNVLATARTASPLRTGSPARPTNNFSNNSNNSNNNNLEGRRLFTPQKSTTPRTTTPQRTVESPRRPTTPRTPVTATTNRTTPQRSRVAPSPTTAQKTPTKAGAPPPSLPPTTSTKSNTQANNNNTAQNTFSSQQQQINKPHNTLATKTTAQNQQMKSALKNPPTIIPVYSSSLACNARTFSEESNDDDQQQQSDDYSNLDVSTPPTKYQDSSEYSGSPYSDKRTLVSGLRASHNVVTPERSVCSENDDDDDDDSSTNENVGFELNYNEADTARQGNDYTYFLETVSTLKKSKNDPLHFDIEIENLSDVFELVEEIGSGGYSQVWKAVGKQSREERAVKMVEKETYLKHKTRMEAEAAVLASVSHPAIVKFFGIIRTPTHFCFVLELLKGGELFDRIIEQKFGYPEPYACQLITTIFSAIEHLHEQGVVHRDIKPENFLFSTENNASLKLIDFGFATFMDPQGWMIGSSCGTPDYIAPELLLEKPHNQAVDMWSAGVVLYILLCGFPPFFAEDDDALFDLIADGCYGYPSPQWDHISKEARHLVSSLLVVEPKQRLTASQALNHPWIVRNNLLNSKAMLDKRLQQRGK